MATQHTGNDPRIVDSILSPLCWAEYSRGREDREYDYENLVRLIKYLKSGKANRKNYSEAVTHTLKHLLIPESEWTVLRALASAYFKALKPVKQPTQPDPLWSVTVLEASREIRLYHYPTMTRSDSLYDHTQCYPGSVSTEDRPCRHKQHIELHRGKCLEVFNGLHPQPLEPGAE